MAPRTVDPDAVTTATTKTTPLGTAGEPPTERLWSYSDFPGLPLPVQIRWYQRSLVTVAAGLFGVVGLVVLAIAVLAVSHDSTQPSTSHSTVSRSPQPLRTTTPTPSGPATAVSPGQPPLLPSTTDAGPASIDTTPPAVATTEIPAPSAQSPPPAPAWPRWWRRHHPRWAP